MEVLIHQPKCMSWHNSAALFGSSMVRIPYKFLGSILCPSISMIRTYYLTFLVYDTDFFAERYSFYLLHILKNSSKWFRSCDSVLVCRVKSSLRAFTACFMLSNNGGIVAWKYAGACFSPWRTWVDTKVPCGATMP